MQPKWYPILAGTLIVLSFMACNQREGQAEKEFFDLCHKINKYIEQAQAIASDLEDFKWNEFSNVGIVCPTTGVCPVGSLPIAEKNSLIGEATGRWVSLVERLPSPQVAKTYSLQCNNCLKLATEVCSRSPYNESQAFKPQAEQLTLTQWQDLCGQLQSALLGAEYLVLRNETIAADYTFPQLLTYLTDSDEKIKQKYLNKFLAKSDKYTQLHAELIHNIQQAEQVAIELANWQLSSQSPEEQ
ncbi:MAG: hypothetical protein FJ023_02910 [Chloroflexi bacterium]|nr:hypothetical protein [Chloroflexota bacterium]